MASPVPPPRQNECAEQPRAVIVEEMRRYTLRLPDDLADELDREAQQQGISVAQYLSVAVAYRLGRDTQNDEIAAIHARLNKLEERIRRRR